MSLEFQIIIAFLIDLIVGDPAWFPHPVRWIGCFARSLETPLRKWVKHERTAGLVAVIFTVGSSGLVAWLMCHWAYQVNPIVGDVVSIFLLYLAFATRDLATHAWRVYRALRQDDLPKARHYVAMLVGRDTDLLDEAEVTRAAVESVAENLVDGVTAPLFFAVIGGPVGVWIYKAISTLDSTFGYKTTQYFYFGWASARLDDVANWIPARLTIPVMALAAGLLGMQSRKAVRICLRDASQHASPNAGLPEAAMAGALELQLGGLNYYDGQPCEGPRFGDPGRRMEKTLIPAACTLMVTTAVLTLLAFLGARLLVSQEFFTRGITG